MINENLRQTMGKEWQKVRKAYHYPQLPQPELVDDVPNGMIDIRSLEIKVSEHYIGSFEEHGITPKEALNEVLTHELTHFMKFPGSVLNILRLQKSAQDLADGKRISDLRTDYTEAQVNLYLLNELQHPATSRIGKVLVKRGAIPSPSGNIMHGLYQEASGQDYGVELNEEEKGLVARLREIDFLDQREETSNFRTFVQILKDYNPPQNQQSEQGQGNGEGQQSQGEPCAGSGNGFEGFTENQIREGLKQFAQECSNPGEYEEIVGQVLGEMSQEGERQRGQQRKIGRKAGLGRGITEFAENFYTALAEKYAVPIRKKPMHKNGGLYPYSHETFEIGDSITEVDAFSTPGILPGITKKFLRREGEVHDNEEAVPDSFIVIDNSPSMFMPHGNEVVDPSKRTYPHIVGATAISNAYLMNDSRVAVYSFGSDDHLTNPTKNRELVHRELRRYSSNGGTTFNPGFLEGVLSQSEGEFDVSVVSDMNISNLDAFVESVLRIPQTHRIHLLYTEDNDIVKGLRKSFGNKENVAILPLISEQDIYRITMGELKKSVR